MKYINEFGQASDLELQIFLKSLEDMVGSFCKGLSAIECQLIAKHASTAVSFAATSQAVRSQHYNYKRENNHDTQ